MYKSIIYTNLKKSARVKTYLARLFVLIFLPMNDRNGRHPYNWVIYVRESGCVCRSQCNRSDLHTITHWLTTQPEAICIVSTLASSLLACNKETIKTTYHFVLCYSDIKLCLLWSRCRFNLGMHFQVMLDSVELNWYIGSIC